METKISNPLSQWRARRRNLPQNRQGGLGAIGIGLLALLAFGTGAFGEQTIGNDLGRFSDTLLPVWILAIAAGAIVAGIAEVLPLSNQTAIRVLRDVALVLRIATFAILAAIVVGLLFL